MSLGRVRHGLSPAAEAAVIVMAAALGVSIILLDALRPLDVPFTALVQNVSPPISLDAGMWTIERDTAHGYEYAVPPGWVSVAGRDTTFVASGAGHLDARGPRGTLMSIETRPLGQGFGPEDLAAQEFAGTRPAMYDIAVDGRPGLFAVAFDGRRVGPQAAYVPLKDDRVLVIRGDGIDPAAFSVFVSSIRFFTL